MFKWSKTQGIMFYSHLNQLSLTQSLCHRLTPFQSRNVSQSLQLLVIVTKSQIFSSQFKVTNDKNLNVFTRHEVTRWQSDIKLFFRVSIFSFNRAQWLSFFWAAIFDWNSKHVCARCLTTIPRLFADDHLADFSSNTVWPTAIWPTTIHSKNVCSARL